MVRVKVGGKQDDVRNEASLEDGAALIRYLTHTGNTNVRALDYDSHQSSGNEERCSSTEPKLASTDD